MNNLEKIVVSLKDSRPLVKIGWTGENDARGIVWDISTWQTIYGEGICTLLNQREQDTAPYPCPVTIDGKFAVWQVTDGDLGSGGNGKCQLVYTVGEEVVAKSPVYKTLASRSLSGEIEPPDQFDSWIDQIVQAGAQAQAAASTATSKAGEASSSAEAAEGSAQAAQAAASSVEELVPIPTAADNGKIMMVVDGKWEAVEPGITSWEKVQLIVRAGLAPRYFPVGYEFITHDSTEDTDIIWRVVGYDTIKAADETLIHTMILETKYVYSDSLGSGIAVQFDAQEALFCVEAGLEPGTYHFTLLSGYDEANGGGGTYSFTLTQFVPSGGVLLFNWQYTLAQNGTISTYTAQTAAEPIETVSVSEGAEGTNLGTDDGSTANMNNTPRARYGSNNYAQSAIRQWLNSAAPAGSVWHPQTKFDRPPIWAGSLAGFMAGLPQDFLAVVQSAAVPCRTNNVFEVDSLDGTEFSINQTYILEDKFFILSRPEIYGSYDNELIKDGEQLDFYQNLTDAERIKYSQLGIATNSGMRSPYVDVGDHFRIINSPSGNFGVRVASGIWNCTASCIIG